MKRNDSNEQEWSYFLDAGKENTITIKYLLSEDGREVIEFVIIYTTLINGEPKEVIKYDISKKEALNVHYYYQKPGRKTYINKPVSFETMWEFARRIETNWWNLKQKFIGE